MSDPKTRLWDAFCAAHQIRDRGVELFDADGPRVRSAPYGLDGRPILCRSPRMERMLIAQAARVLGEPLDGVLYLMHWRDGSRVLPLYFGKAGKYGKSDGNISANLLKLDRDRSKFARWGSNYAYHIGDLSAAACPGHDPRKITPKYRRWADRLLSDVPSLTLRRPVYFWATAWGPDSPSIWPEYGSSSLSFQEYLLIGVASDLFAGTLLNDEGVNRPGPPVDVGPPS